MFKFLQRYFVRPDARATAPAPEVDPDTEIEERPPGCGWFDSSHELRHGLLVTEHGSADAVAADLPLAGWLELHLCGWRGGIEAAPQIG